MAELRTQIFKVTAWVAAAAVACLGLWAYGLEAEQGHPSILLIIIDTLRADHLGCYGYGRNTSPNIDELAAQSIFFKNAISTAPWTSPAIGSMFTAQYPHVLGYESEAVVLDERFLCLAEILRNQGYTTHGIISHIYVSHDLGFDQGFQSYDEENAQGHGHVSSPSVTDKAIAFLDEHKNDKFLLFLHYFDPHCDYILHEPYNYYPEYQGPLMSGQPIEDLRLRANTMSADDVRYLNALYDSEIRFTDEHLGRLLEHLKEIGIYDDLLIVLVADHGEEFLERGDFWIGHTKAVYQELVHVPFIVKLPGKPEARVVEQYVSLVDLMPTMVSAAGLEVPEGYQHDGMAMDLASGTGPWRQKVFTETKRWGSQEAVIQDAAQ
jgi:arylsulfatase A-like enzyme